MEVDKVRVVFLSDCISQDWDEDKECPECPQCGDDYSDCQFPGPMMDDLYEYEWVDDVLYAKIKT